MRLRQKRVLILFIPPSLPSCLFVVCMGTNYKRTIHFQMEFKIIFFKDRHSSLWFVSWNSNKLLGSFCFLSFNLSIIKRLAYFVYWNVFLKYFDPFIMKVVFSFIFKKFMFLFWNYLRDSVNKNLMAWQKLRQSYKGDYVLKRKN